MLSQNKNLRSLALPHKNKNQSLFDWLYRSLRHAIISGQIKLGASLPSTRQLATEYKISRGTVVIVYEQLISEGYIQSQRGSRTIVSAHLPDLVLASTKQRFKSEIKSAPDKKIGRKAKLIQSIRLIPQTTLLFKCVDNRYTLCYYGSSSIARSFICLQQERKKMIAKRVR